jgi:hypothetical protein
MNSNQTWMTAQSPSAFGMPISSHTFCVSAIEGRSAVATTLVVRDRQAFIGTNGVDKADLGLAPSYFPGTRAWSPPTC